MAANGIAQRATSTFVTDGAGDTYSLGAAYPETRSGETFGWSVDSTANARDRGTVRPKLAGIVFHSNGSGTRYFRWDKPAGTYTVRVALGDDGNSQVHKLVIRDGVGGTALATITGSTGSVEWLDATGVVRAGLVDITQSVWERDNVSISLTNASGAFVFEIGDSAGGSAASTLAYVSVVGAAAAPVITGPSGAAGAGSSTANIAETASTGPTFTTDIALGGGYPTLTGAQAANWAITALSSTSWRIDPVAPFNFEAGGLVNPQAIVFNASASVSQSCSVTVTNASEPPLAPTIGTAAAGNASASVAFTPPSNTGRPAISGYTATSSPGGLTGTGASSPITVSGLTNGTAYTFTVTATNADGTGPASAASNSVTPSAGDVTPPTMSAAGVTGGTLSATGSIASNEAGTLWWKMDGSATAADPGPGSEVGAGWTSQSMLAAANSVNFSTQPAGLRYGHFLGIDAAGNRAAVVNASGTVNGAALAGFDFDTVVGCVFGNVSGSLAGLGRETAGRQINVYAKTVGTDTTVAYSAALTLDSNGRLPRWTHASLALGTDYDLLFCPVDGGKPGIRRMRAT